MEPVLREEFTGPTDIFRPLVYWYLSLRCNLACKHCWVESSPHADTSTDLKPEDIQPVLQKLREIDPRMIILTGGEPLMRSDTASIIETFIDYRIPFSVETNGILLNERYVSLFRRALDQGVYCWISVSLDGGTRDSHEWVRGKNSFNPTVRGLHRLKESNIPFGVQCVVNKKNLHSIPQLFEVGTELNLNTEDNVLAFVVVNPVGRGGMTPDEMMLTFEEYQFAFQLIADNLDSFSGGVLIKVPPGAIPPRFLQRFMGDPKVKFLTSCVFPLLGILPDGKLSVCALTGENGSLILGDARHDSLTEVVQRNIAPLRENYENATLTGICADCIFKESFLGPHPVCHGLQQENLFPDVYRTSYHDKLRGGKVIPLTPTARVV